MFSNDYSDFTTVTVGEKQFIRVGTPIEWAAFVRAGYVVNSTIRPVRGSKPSQSLSMLVPEMGRHIARLRDEAIGLDITEAEYVAFVNGHADYFQSRRTQNI